MTAKKRIVPTVKPVVIDEEQDDAVRDSEGNEWDEEVSLPPIGHIKPPEMKHTSTKIRWYCGLGYTIKEVSNFLGVRYQQVRNVASTSPKRAAREDVPPYKIELWELDDDLEAMDKHAMEQQMSAQREETREARRAMKRKQFNEQD